MRTRKASPATTACTTSSPPSSGCVLFSLLPRPLFQPDLTRCVAHPGPSQHPQLWWLARPRHGVWSERRRVPHLAPARLGQEAVPARHLPERRRQHDGAFLLSASLVLSSSRRASRSRSCAESSHLALAARRCSARSTRPTRPTTRSSPLSASTRRPLRRPRASPPCALPPRQPSSRSTPRRTRSRASRSRSSLRARRAPCARTTR